jgi:hypothetical protein
LSYFLGGRAPSENGKGWLPNMAAVKATLKYAREIERFQEEVADQQHDLCIYNYKTHPKHPVSKVRRL